MSILAVDIGGTKIMCALVEGGRVIETRRAATARSGGPEDWLAEAAALCDGWTGQAALGIAVTGRVDAEGRWSPLNRATLDIPEETPLVARAEALFGCPARAVNDAQAAAWAEHLHGAGQGRDMVFLTVSTGIGGGIVCGGRLLGGRGGLAGHFGQTRAGGSRLEDRAAGRWLSAEAQARGVEGGAEAVFAAAAAGEPWAEALREACLDEVARLCSDIQLMLDPEVIVIGGGIGLSEGFLAGLEARQAALSPVLRPDLRAAELGAEAGVIGAAALAEELVR